MSVCQVIKNGIRQTEIRNAVTHDTAYFVSAVKDGDFISVSCQNDGYGNTGRTCTDDSCFASV